MDLWCKVSVNHSFTKNILSDIFTTGAYYVGCWRVDPSNLTISSMGDFYGFDHSKTVRKCAELAVTNGFSVFAMFNNTECLTDANAYRTFSLLGPSKNCGVFSMGATDAISVYTYEKRKDLCFNEFELCYDMFCKLLSPVWFA